jgi:hypothetical protein
MRRAQGVLLSLLALCPPAHAEILVRWDQDRVPSPGSLGLSSIVLPADKETAIRHALSQGYRVLVEIDAASVDTMAPVKGVAGMLVSGSLPDVRLQQLARRLDAPGARAARLDLRGTWPHIRTNWVTLNNGVLQVTARSAQPWIENNVARMRLARAKGRERAPFLSYPWQPITAAEADEGPSVESYLVAIAEAGSFGGDLLLRLHPRLQRALLAGDPSARAGWDHVRRYLEFYSRDLPQRYRPIANVGLLAHDPGESFEVMNLLARHNLLFELLSPSGLPAADLSRLDLIVAFDEPDAAASNVLSTFVQRGGLLVIAAPPEGSGAATPERPASRPWSGPPVETTAEQVRYRFGDGTVVERKIEVADPNAFAFDVRELLGPERRPLDLWNGITVMAALYEDPAGRSSVVNVLNYAHQPLPVQLRVKGTFSRVRYESPGEPPATLPYRHRHGYTEIVLPALHVGGRILLGGETRQ